MTLTSPEVVFLSMPTRSLKLVLHYDGTGFSGWQRQPERRTVQGVLEEALARICAGPVAALGSGRTDAGVHARGQAVGIKVPDRWTDVTLRKALNSLLPNDLWVASVHTMRDDFHARFNAMSRRYTYYVGTDELAASPFRRRTEWVCSKPLETHLLAESATMILGTHAFRGFAVRGTAPANDNHQCTIAHAGWEPFDGGLAFTVEANRFLHHMVRFLVGTMVDIATRRRPVSDMSLLLSATSNDEVSPPAPPHALFLDVVRYPADVYIPAET